MLARKVQANIMSVFAAVKEQHPDWDDEAIYKEANLIYAEKQLNIQVVDRTKPLEESTVLQTPPEEDADGGGADAEMDLQDTNDTDDEEQIDEQS